MENQNEYNAEEIFSKAFRAGRRTYFFDVRETKAGDYYLTITESKKFTNEDGTFYYKKHKIYLYKEDFEGFNELLKEMKSDAVLKEISRTAELAKKLQISGTPTFILGGQFLRGFVPLEILLQVAQSERKK